MSSLLDILEAERPRPARLKGCEPLALIRDFFTRTSNATDQSAAALAVASDIARVYFDGHLSIFKFTWNWKVIFGTSYCEPQRMFSTPFEEKADAMHGRQYGRATLYEAIAVAIQLLESFLDAYPEDCDKAIEKYGDAIDPRLRELREVNTWGSAR